MKDILLIGGGGHCKSVIDTINEGVLFNIVGILDIREKIGTYVSNTKVIGSDDDLEFYHNEGIVNAFITLGSIGNPKLRIEVYKKAKEIGLKFPKIIDETAIISNNTVLGEGTFVGKGVIINTDVKIGKNCILNTGAVIEHDCKVEDFVHIAPGSILSGNVYIKENSHIGTGSSIIQGVNIGHDVLIGAGSTVISNIPDDAVAFGVPAKIKSFRNK